MYLGIRGSEVGESTQNQPKELADCVKIQPSIKNIQKNLMCFFWTMGLYLAG
jgi:hypothetical protein